MCAILVIPCGSPTTLKADPSERRRPGWGLSGCCKRWAAVEVNSQRAADVNFRSRPENVLGDSLHSFRTRPGGALSREGSAASRIGDDECAKHHKIGVPSDPTSEYSSRYSIA